MADITIKYNNSTVTTINSTQTEVLDTSGKYLEDDIKIEYVKPAPNLQTDKYVTPSTSSQTVYPDAGYEGLAYVAVNPISPTKSAQTYTPTTVDQTISSGRWLLGAQTIKGDANLTSGNIKSGVSIFGVSGTYKGYTAKQVLEGTASCLNGTYVDNETTVLASGAYAFNNYIRSVTFSSCSVIGSSAFYFCRSLATASFPVCTTIRNYAFHYCDYLSTISFPVCTSIGSGAFYACDHLSTISFPSCQSIGSSAFYACTSVREISLPECLYIGDDAFRMADSAHPIREASVTSIDLPKCQSIGSNAFGGVGPLTSINLPACTFVGYDAFGGTTKNLSFLSLPSCVSIESHAFHGDVNRSLTSLDLPVCTSIGANAFTSFAFLRSVSLPECLSIGSYAFRYCSSLSTVSLPRCSRINSAAFAYCTALTSVRLDAIDAALFYIGSEAFARCYNLLSLYLLGDSVGTLTSINAFTSTPISTYTASTGGVRGSIFVRASLLTAYQSAARWATYKSRFVGLTDAEIAALG